MEVQHWHENEYAIIQALIPVIHPGKAALGHHSTGHDFYNSLKRLILIIDGQCCSIIMLK
jgi:hypothetical protein